MSAQDDKSDSTCIGGPEYERRREAKVSAQDEPRGCLCGECSVYPDDGDSGNVGDFPCNPPPKVSAQDELPPCECTRQTHAAYGSTCAACVALGELKITREEYTTMRAALKRDTEHPMSQLEVIDDALAFFLSECTEGDTDSPPNWAAWAQEMVGHDRAGELMGEHFRGEEVEAMRAAVERCAELERGNAELERQRDASNRLATANNERADKAGAALANEKHLRQVIVTAFSESEKRAEDYLAMRTESYLTMEAQRDEARAALTCHVTKNQCGTDTRPIDQPCPCPACEAWEVE